MGVRIFGTFRGSLDLSTVDLTLLPYSLDSYVLGCVFGTKAEDCIELHKTQAAAIEVLVLASTRNSYELKL
jgi:hypothetical protein